MAAELPDWMTELPDWVLDALRREASAHPRKATSPSREFETLAAGVITAACGAKVRLDDLVYEPDTREVGIGNGYYRKAEPGKEIDVLYELLIKEKMRYSVLTRAERKAERIERGKRSTR